MMMPEDGKSAGILLAICSVLQVPVSSLGEVSLEQSGPHKCVLFHRDFAGSF